MVRDCTMCCDELIRMGGILRAARLEKRMTQDMLAEKSGVSKHHITHIEQGKANPSYTVLKLILSALNFSTDALFYENLGNEKANEDRLLLIYRSCAEAKRPIILNVVSTLADGLKECEDK